MRKYTLVELGGTRDIGVRYYLASEVDAKFKEYDDDNLALSQSVSKLGARIVELEKALGESTCPYPIGDDHAVSACIKAGKCGCANKSLMVK